MYSSNNSRNYHASIQTFQVGIYEIGSRPQMKNWTSNYEAPPMTAWLRTNRGCSKADKRGVV